MKNSPLTDVRELEQWLDERLPILGHRNWLVVSDSAYPSQTVPGIETVMTGVPQVETLTVVSRLLKASRHVRPMILLDQELTFLKERELTGIDQFQKQLGLLLQGQERQYLPHEEIIRMLDEAGRQFHVLVIKTACVLPYTSVFFRLECAYWSEQQEKNLRLAMTGASPDFN